MTVAQRVRKVLLSETGHDESELTDDAELAADLGLDSLDLVEIQMALEEEFDVTIPDEEAESLTTVGKVVAYLERKVS